MSADLVIAGAEAVLPGGRALIDIGVRSGRIAQIAEAGTLAGARVLDARGLIALPGAVDMHVHLRDPGATHKEDFEHGTAAAACGGVTAICDMPNTRPPVTSAAVLGDKLAAVAGRAHVDYGFWAGGSAIAEFAAMKALGAVGLKIFMNRPEAGSQSYSGELSIVDNETLIGVMRAAAGLDWPVCVHVQSPDLDEALQRAMRAAGRNSPRDVCEMTRSPASAEAQARLIRFAGLTGARLHIAHISYNAIGALDDLRAARAAGSRTTTEVAPPCLSFADLERVGVLGIPFAHSDEDNQRYWEALGDGTIDAVATDHAPHTREEKLRGAENAWLAASGYPGVETMMPLMLDGAFSGRITLERLVEVTAANPARICGLPRKGAIAIGRDADLILVDPAGIWEIDEARMHSKAGWSPYHGRRLKGRIRHVFLRGTEIARDGELLDAPKMGQHMAVTPAQ